MNKLLGFDPLIFLGIKKLKEEHKTILSKQLLNKIAQYILIRIVEILPTADLKEINNPEKIFSLAKDKIPDFNSKVKLFLEDFKKEFYKNITT